MTQSRDYARMTMTITLTHPVSISVLDDLLALVKRLFTKAYLVGTTDGHSGYVCICELVSWLIY